MFNNASWIIGISGASGIIYAQRLVQILTEQLPELNLEIIISEGALRVMKDEQEVSISPSAPHNERCKKIFNTTGEKIRFHNIRDIGASIASGSYPAQGMLIIPCSMATLGKIAYGCGENLIHRAADVTLKEKRPLIIVPRETPLTTIHLEAMLKLATAGARIVPAMPGFYHRPQSVSDLVDHFVMRVLDQMGFSINIAERWKVTRGANE